MNKVGISGFVVIAITVIIYTFSTAQQKAEIIDDWLLFKGPSTPFYIISGILILLLLGQSRTHVKRTEIYRKE
jgi:multisubunit Na+/H+ antiporter MnhB subunit